VLNGTAVTAAGLRQLQDPPRLSTLALGRTKLGDADLAVFTAPEHFQALRDLQLDGTQVTAQGLILLRKARPGLSAWLPRS
jgi:hypothetical protein